LIYSFAWVRAIVTIALLAQWGGKGHAAGKGHGFDSQKCQKNIPPEFLSPVEMTKGKFLGCCKFL
jgi:hypothetical protein